MLENLPTISVGDIADAALENDFRYIEGLSKEENLQYRKDITDYIVYLFVVMGKMDWRAEDYVEATSKMMVEIEELNALDRQYYEDYKKLTQQEANDETSVNSDALSIDGARLYYSYDAIE